MNKTPRRNVLLFFLQHATEIFWWTELSVKFNNKMFKVLLLPFNHNLTFVVFIVVVTFAFTFYLKFLGFFSYFCCWFRSERVYGGVVWVVWLPLISRKCAQFTIKLTFADLILNPNIFLYCCCYCHCLKWNKKKKKIFLRGLNSWSPIKCCFKIFCHPIKCF